jgi:predicted O-methyltransferase YrrM
MSLIDKWGAALAGARDIFTWTAQEELAWLAEHASTSEIIVEIGSYMGHSAKVMSAATPGTVYCVDTWEPAGSWNVFEYFLRGELASGKVKALKLQSPAAAKELEHLRGMIDMVFVDDGHLATDVVRDIDAFLPLMRTPGLICGHDYERGNAVAIGVKHCLEAPHEIIKTLWSKWV